MTAHAAETPEPDGHGWPSPPSSLEDRRADRKSNSHRWNRWLRAVKKLAWLPRSKTLRQLLDELVQRADNETGEWRLYLVELAESMSASERTVQRRMREAVDLGLIEYKPGRSNPKTKSWFRLIPLDEIGATGCHPRGDSLSPQGRHADRPGPTPGHPTGDTVSPLTALGTTNVKGTPLAPQGGNVDRAGSFSDATPPKRPAGRRARDTEQWLARVDTWAIAQGLPAEHLAVVRQAVQMGHADYASIVAHLERWTDWREHDSYPAHPNPTHPTPKNARARGEQMNFDAEGW